MSESTGVVLVGCPCGGWPELHCDKKKQGYMRCDRCKQEGPRVAKSGAGKGLEQAVAAGLAWNACVAAAKAIGNIPRFWVFQEYLVLNDRHKSTAVAEFLDACPPALQTEVLVAVNSNAALLKAAKAVVEACGRNLTYIHERHEQYEQAVKQLDTVITKVEQLNAVFTKAEDRQGGRDFTGAAG